MKKNLIKAVVIVMAVIVVFSVGEMASAKTKPETTYKTQKSQNNEVSVQSKAVVYNNGTTRVEYKGVLYFTDYKEGIYSFDLKTKKKTALKTEGYLSRYQLWIVGERIFYLSEGGHLNSMKLDGSGKKIIREGLCGEDGGISKVAIKGDYLYLSSWERDNHTLNIEKIKPSGTKIAEVSLECEEQPLAVVDNVVIGDYAQLYKNKSGKYTIDLYVGKMEKLKLVSGEVAGNFNCDGLNNVKAVKKYGDYLYGYCNLNPGSFMDLTGSVFAFSIKTGKIEMDGKNLFLNNSCFVKDSFYVSANEKDEEVIKYKINRRTGKWKKETYSCGLGTVAGDNIYYERNEKGRKAIVSYSMKNRKETVIHDAYKAKDEFYYGVPTSPDSYIDVINGRLYMRVADCSSNTYVGWRLIADQYMEYIIDLKSKKCTIMNIVK